jgi:hypothetical protein
MICLIIFMLLKRQTLFNSSGLSIQITYWKNNKITPQILLPKVSTNPMILSVMPRAYLFLHPNIKPTIVIGNPTKGNNQASMPIQPNIAEAGLICLTGSDSVSYLREVFILGSEGNLCGFIRVGSITITCLQYGHSASCPSQLFSASSDSLHMGH